MPVGGRRRTTAAAVALVAGTTLLHAWYAGRLPLSPGEAALWEAARHLDLSYFDHPPLAPWTIRAAVELVGTSERAVRLGAVASAAVAALLLFGAGRRLFGGPAALVALAVALATPLFSLGGVLASTEAPLVAASCAALYCAARALDGGAAWLVPAGVAAGAAALADRSGALVAGELAAALALDPRGRRLLRTAWPWLGLAAAIAVLAPALAWTARHGWAAAAPSLAPAGRAPASAGARTMRALGVQALLVTPLLGGVLWVAAVAAALRRDAPALRLCAVFALPPLLLGLALAPLGAARTGALAPGFAAALLAAAAFLVERPRERGGLAVAAGALALAISAYLHAAAVSPALPLPPRQIANAGWPELAARVEAERRRLARDGFVLGCGGGTAAALAFYLPGRPATLSSNLLGDALPQYDEWAPAPERGAEGIVVLDRRERALCSARARRCAPLERLRPLVVRRGGVPVTAFDLWRCRWTGG